MYSLEEVIALRLLHDVSLQDVDDYGLPQLRIPFSS